MVVVPFQQLHAPEALAFGGLAGDDTVLAAFTGFDERFHRVQPQIALLLFFAVTARAFFSQERGDDGLIDSALLHGDFGRRAGDEEGFHLPWHIKAMRHFAAEMTGHADGGSGGEEGETVNAGSHSGFGVVDEFGDESESRG